VAKPVISETFAARVLTASGIALVAGALLHLAAIFGGPAWYAALGAPAGLVAMAATGSPRPAISCVVIASVLLVWAAYAFSGAGAIRRLPALRVVLALVATVLIARGVLFLPIAAWRPHLLAGLCGKCAEPGVFLFATSAVCVLLGLGFAVGAMSGLHRRAAPAQARG
jgi:hypothetical protein